MDEYKILKWQNLDINNNKCTNIPKLFTSNDILQLYNFHKFNV